MADADLDVIIRQLAKQQTRTLTAAAKKRRGHFEALAAKAKDAAGKARYKDIAKEAQAQGLAAAKRLQVSADNAADSYARAMRKAVEAPAKPAAPAPASKKAAPKSPAPKASAPKKAAAKKTKR
jgi:ribosomal protein S21